MFSTSNAKGPSFGPGSVAAAPSLTAGGFGTAQASAQSGGFARAGAATSTVGGFGTAGTGGFGTTGKAPTAGFGTTGTTGTGGFGTTGTGGFGTAGTGGFGSAGTGGFGTTGKAPTAGFGTTGTTGTGGFGTTGTGGFGTAGTGGFGTTGTTGTGGFGTTGTGGFGTAGTGGFGTAGTGGFGTAGTGGFGTTGTGGFGTAGTAGTGGFGTAGTGGFGTTGTTGTGGFGTTGTGGFGTAGTGGFGTTGTGGFGTAGTGGFGTAGTGGFGTTGTGGFGVTGSIGFGNPPNTATTQPLTIQEFGRQSALARYLFELDNAYNALHPNCRFRAILYNMCAPGQATQAVELERLVAAQAGGGCKEEDLLIAQEANPDPLRMYPTPVHFMQGLKARAEKQQEVIAAMSQHAESLLRKAEHFRSVDEANAALHRELQLEQVMLQRRWYGLLRKVETIRQAGQPLGEEARLAGAAAALTAQLAAPGAYRTALAELEPFLDVERAAVAATRRAQGGRATGGESVGALRQRIDPQVLKGWVQFTERIQQGIEALDEVLERDTADMKAIRRRVESS